MSYNISSRPLNDLIVWNGGSLMMVRPVSEAGKRWLDETAPDNAQFLGDSMAVEWRYIEGVVEAAREDGLTVA